MDDIVAEFLDSEGLLSQLGERIVDEIGNDDEPFDKIARNILETYKESPEIVDKVLVALCGWRVESLLKSKVYKIILIINTVSNAMFC